MDIKLDNLINIEDLEVVELDSNRVKRALKGQVAIFNPNDLKGVLYKGVLIFTTVDDDLKGYKVKIHKEPVGQDCFYTLQLRDNFGDFYHYGKFYSLDSVKRWLDRPYPLDR